MTLNKRVTLSGYFGANTQIHETKKGLMASFSLSRRDSYKETVILARRVEPAPLTQSDFNENGL